MRKSLCILIFILSLSNFSKAQFIIPGAAPLGSGDEYLIGVRFRALTLGTASTNIEKYVGIPEHNTLFSSTTANVSYSNSNQISFSYDAPSNSITCVTSIAGVTTTTTKNLLNFGLFFAGKTRPLNTMNFFEMRIRNQLATSTTIVSAITVNGNPVPGIFSVSGANALQKWFAFFGGYGTTFNFTASIQLLGTHGSNIDLNSVEFVWGSSLQVLPISIVNTSFIQFGNQQQVGYEIPNYTTNTVDKSILEGSDDGLIFKAIDSTNYVNKTNKFILNNAIISKYYRVRLKLLSGINIYSDVIKANDSKSKSEYKMYNQVNSITISSFNFPITNITIINTNGQIVNRINSNANNTQITLNNLAKGIYYIHFYINNKKFVEKIVR